jgi:NADPH2:quinone reductase
VVEVKASAVDFVDTLIAAGRYQIPVPTPFTPGNDFAGVVREVGPDVARFSVGDRVHGMAFIGAFAEQVAVAEAQLRPTPDGLQSDLACLTGSTYRTAYDALVSTARVAAGDDVVVLGASGAVGSAAITVAKAVGARVVACASTEAKLEFCRKLGADELVAYDDVDLKEALKALCAGGADVVLDMVGGDYSEAALRATGYGGRFVVVGFAAGSIPRIPLNLVLLKGSIVTGYEILDFERRQPEQAATNRDELETMIADCRIVPPIASRFSIDQAVDAMTLVAGREKFGATILDLS